jgi:5-methylcytosine-specific restriction endonuclease McrA
MSYATWAAANREHLRAYHTEWRKRNKMRLAAYRTKGVVRRKTYEAKSEVKAKNTANVLRWQKENRDKVNAKNARWRREHPEARSKESAERRAREMNAPGSHTIAETKRLLVEQGCLCANPFCRADLRKTRRHLDHKTPLARGGSNGIENLQWLCGPCNESKGAKDLDAWLSLQKKAA